ncbi:toll/interleukin-1 receptor domain-containing protein [uncultured Phenylobacterium sp.]|uniref:toll/interleukin-1 receptor domain-containing protein n=1 Tax=uncultured Phenylobacterium sp. TaxID=349273 RepID=UPI0025EEE4D6|nr:toll/interleukin-1 receptor domain-containing protein [uncultured Phenylobacterium sp.]
MPDSAEPRTSTPVATPPARYGAFLSYASGDARFVKRLHRQLETYRLPHRLVGSAPLVDPGSRRLKPVFRDSDELSAAFDLTAAIKDAIASSGSLVVVCSPRSAASKWVGRELDLFRAIHGDERIFAVLVEGSSTTAFPPALGGPDGAFEPLAVNFQTDAAGRRLAFLKLYAALAGVQLDELIQRDAQRGARRATAAAASAVAVTTAVTTLAWLALSAQADAERRRIETTGLVDYMLTDLRKTLQRTGRLDQLAALNDGAMQYYRRQDLKRLSETQLRQRAKLLQAMGEDDEKRGNLEAARESFEDAHRTTAALLAANPDDPDRIFAHAQREYWVGFSNWRTGNGTAARRGLEAYAELACRLETMDPNNAEWRREVGYAESNLGLLAMRQAGDLKAAERHFRTALTLSENLAARKPNDIALQSEVATYRAWLADSQRLGEKFSSALENRLAQRRILTALQVSDPQNREVRSDLLSNDLALARIDADRGDADTAIQRLDQVRAEAVALQQTDPDNRLFAKQARMAELLKVRTVLAVGGAAPRKLSALDSTLGSCSSPVETDGEIATFCMALKARVATLRGDDVAARNALASLPPSRETAALSPRWGLDLKHEIELATNAKRGRGRDRHVEN